MGWTPFTVRCNFYENTAKKTLSAKLINSYCIGDVYSKTKAVFDGDYRSLTKSRSTFTTITLRPSNRQMNVMATLPNTA
jgi:hypothetical protein